MRAHARDGVDTTTTTSRRITITPTHTQRGQQLEHVSTHCYVGERRARRPEEESRVTVSNVRGREGGPQHHKRQQENRGNQRPHSLTGRMPPSRLLSVRSKGDGNSSQQRKICTSAEINSHTLIYIYTYI